jgi:hypothetical protein
MAKAYKTGDPSAPRFPSTFTVVDYVVLNCTNLQGDINKFYRMELQEAGGNIGLFIQYVR